MAAITLSFAVTIEDEALLARIGVPAAPDGIHTLTLSRIEEIVYLLDREAERGDKEAGELAAYFLAGEDVYWDIKRDVQQASL